MFSDRVKRVGASATLKISAKAKAMRRQGIDVIDLSVGEPDFPTPRNVKEAGRRAIDADKTRYTLNQGTVELREAAAGWLRREQGLHYDIREILVSTGAKQSLFNLVMALVDEGDEVIIPAPYWVSYPEMVELAGGTPVILATREEDGFRVDPERLRAAVTPSTKLLLLNNPSNPTGAAYTREHLEALGRVVVEEDILVAADEIYSRLVYDDFRFTSFASLDEEVRRRTVVINGVSKAFAMTGWRLGFAAGPEPIIAAMAKIQGHVTSNASSISQEAAREALSGPQFEVHKMAMEFSRRRNYLYQRVSALPGVSCHRPEGAFYLFPNVSAYYGLEHEGTPMRNSYGLAYFLLKEAAVAVVPGDAFGADDHVRLSYATSMENLSAAMDRISAALGKLKPARRARKASLRNISTRSRKPVPLETQPGAERRNALVAEVESFLPFDHYHEWNANVAGLVIQLRTNLPHLCELFTENFFPAELEADIEPHAVLYAVEGVKGREPHAYYDPETRTAILVNCDDYARLRTLALGTAADVSGRLGDAHAVRGMSLDLDGRGLLLLGPAGTMKTELTFGLLREKGVKLHGIDLSFLHYGGGTATADMPERKLFLPTRTVTASPELEDPISRSLCLNVVTRREDCRNTSCELAGECLLEKGAPWCLFASRDSYALLDPFWIGGREKHARRTSIRWTVILSPESGTGSPEGLKPDEAVRTLEALSTTTGAKGHPFLNPHILDPAEEGLSFQRRSFLRLFDLAEPFLFRVGGLGLPAALDQLKRLTGIS